MAAWLDQGTVMNTTCPSLAAVALSAPVTGNPSAASSAAVASALAAVREPMMTA